MFSGEASTKSKTIDYRWRLLVRNESPLARSKTLVGKRLSRRRSAIGSGGCRI